MAKDRIIPAVTASHEHGPAVIADIILQLTHYVSLSDADGDKGVKRRCVADDDKYYNAYHRGRNGVEVKSYYCKTDLCNSAPVLTSSIMAVFSAVALLILV